MINNIKNTCIAAVQKHTCKSVLWKIQCKEITQICDNHSTVQHLSTSASGHFITTSRTVLAYYHDGIYIWALWSNIFVRKANKLFCNHELYICFENVNDNWLEDYIKSEAGTQKPTFLIKNAYNSVTIPASQTTVTKPFRCNFFRS